MTKAFGTSEKLVDFNDVSEKDVIKIANIQQGEDETETGGDKNPVNETDDKENDKEENDKEENQDNTKKDLDGKRQKLDEIINDTL